MFFVEDCFDSPVSSTARKVKFYRNGNFQLFYEMKLNTTTRFIEIRKTLDSRLEKGFNTLRLFTNEGVEIMEDDIEFIKDGATLYASQGEDFDANSTFSEYEIVSELGEGGFGKVMLGVHKITKQKVAIKILKTHMIGNAQVRHTLSS
jgi:serine/threonine protein kinase